MYKFIMLGFAAILGGTLISRIMEGSFFTAADATIFNSLTVYRTVTIFGLFDIPWVNLDFFTVGLPHLFTWDFAFFGGGYDMFKYLLYVVSNGLVFMILIIFVGVIYQAWSRT